MVTTLMLDSQSSQFETAKIVAFRYDNEDYQLVFSEGTALQDKCYAIYREFGQHGVDEFVYQHHRHETEQYYCDVCESVLPCVTEGGQTLCLICWSPVKIVARA